MTQGEAPKPTLRLLAWKPVKKGTLRGFATVELPSGLQIPDVAVFQKGDRLNAVLPRKPVINSEGRHAKDQRGEPLWVPALRWRDRGLEDGFSQRLGALLRTQHPADFDGGSDG